MYLYGDIEAGFRYEKRRNSDFVQVGAEHRSGTSVFLYTDQNVQLKSGRPAACMLVAFVDDHFILGRPQASRNICKRLEGRAEYKERSLTLGAIEPAFGIEVTLTIAPLYTELRVSQGDYGRLWVGRFKEIVNGRLSKRPPNKKLLGFQAVRMKAPGGNGVLGDVARSYISAAM